MLNIFYTCLLSSKWSIRISWSIKFCYFSLSGTKEILNWIKFKDYSNNSPDIQNHLWISCIYLDINRNFYFWSWNKFEHEFKKQNNTFYSKLNHLRRRWTHFKIGFEKLSRKKKNKNEKQKFEKHKNGKKSKNWIKWIKLITTLWVKMTYF